jgi:diguanylate cyclase (GGDEF)-like protein
METSMQRKRLPMPRTMLVPVLVLVLGVGAIASITGLEAQSRESAEAQLKLTRVENSLNVLQAAPFRASPELGGSPALARGLLDSGRREIDRAVAELRDASAPPELQRLPRALRNNYATLERIYTTGADGELDDETLLLGAQSLGQARQIVEQIQVAGRVYEQRSESADVRATTGSAVVILLLVGGFGLLYRRSVRARTMAEQLVVENGRLLAASRVEAMVDSLTALPNRRSLRRDLDAVLDGVDGGQEHLLAIMDLNGFKQYNDTFGHLAGDALLARLGARLAAAMQGRGTAYRMGGDEFCVLAVAGADGGAELVEVAAEALSEAGEAFDIGCSHGRALIRSEAITVEDALQLADRRMYNQKAGRSSSGRQSTDVLLRVLSERSPNLHDHLSNVAELAEAVSRRAGLSELDVQWIRIAAELHDVGKVAIPDAILNKPGPLNDEEWAFMRRHTIIGERIIRSAPSLAPAAALVRSSHERYDGTGYPDALSALEIAMGASIIAICDAYDAMTNHRVYREAKAPQEALDELRRCAGTQFEPGLVEVFCATVERREAQLVAAAGEAGAGDAAASDAAAGGGDAHTG